MNKWDCNTGIFCKLQSFCGAYFFAIGDWVNLDVFEVAGFTFVKLQAKVFRLGVDFVLPLSQEEQQEEQQEEEQQEPPTKIFQKGMY